ncbi:putative ferric-chelate reductase 1 [Protopterus annectens]|uniref:putative ferric-chelate reductase 1 n=1 Tax=Protopterus annectens TaxID=7888 RepID=UPI001CFA74FC|nr:putative ferric-chelate reductase 1 [Protopterus annectens]
MLTGVSAYQNGLVSEACITMVPGHGYSQQSTIPPYSVSVQNSVYSPGDTITVTIESANQPFKGFLLSTRTIAKDEPIGTFSIIDSSTTQGIQCNGKQNAAASHTSSSFKNKVQVKWISPNSSEDIQLKVTVVQSYSTYWANFLGPTIYRSQQNNSTTTTSAAVTKTSIISTAITPQSTAGSKTILTTASTVSNGCYTIQILPELLRLSILLLLIVNTFLFQTYTAM